MPVSVLQPHTPVFQGMTATAAPVTPAPDAKPGVEETLEEQKTFPDHAVPVHPKEGNDVGGDFASCDGTLIKIFSDTDSSASQSASDGLSADDEQALQPDDEVPALGPDPNFVLKVQNTKTKIAHETKGRYLFDVHDEKSFEQDVKGTQTACGRIIDAKFKLVHVETDWTHRCRVCFKGRRDPRLGEAKGLWHSL